jgi:hypothetical protein
MRQVAWVLLVAGTIVGSLGGARLPEASYPVAAAGVALIIVAAVLLHAKRKQHRAGSLEHGEVLAAMRALAEPLGALTREAPELPLSEIAARIAHLNTTYFAPIADGAPRMLSAMGATRYADVFTTYASGERAISRAWSAASDHHRPETLAALRAGTARIEEALDKLGASA